MPELADGVRGLEETRPLDLETWMDEQSRDAVVFPAVADVGPAAGDRDQGSADLARRKACGWLTATW
jgi:amidase